ncbi:hypothetical protein [Yoonia sp. MH D7]
MIAVAALSGVVCGIAIVFIMHQNGMLSERSGAAVLLVAIAIFYPVFAFAVADPMAILLHSTVFAGFAFLATRAFHLGLHLIAGGLIAHSIFDIIIGVVHITGPVWWPAFCAGLDFTTGILILRLIQIGKIPQ